MTNKLAVFDFDSTLMDGETLEFFARTTGIEQKVKEITDRAMGGELDFFESLTYRVSLLKGLSVDMVNKICAQLPVMNGAKEVVAGLKDRGYKVVCFSGGFRNATKLFAQKLGLDSEFANIRKVGLIALSLDDDDVPELLYSSSKDFGYGICTYSNGKVTEMGIDSVDTIHVLPETGYCYIESAAHFSGGETVYKLEKGVFKEICREYHYVDVGEDEYYVNGLETTESEYDSVHSRIPTYDRAMIFGSPYSELNRMYFSDGISVMTYVELTEALSK